jgi:hypothetical protein
MGIILSGLISWENCWCEDPGYKEGTSEVRTSMAGQGTFAPDSERSGGDEASIIFLQQEGSCDNSNAQQPQQWARQIIWAG